MEDESFERLVGLLDYPMFLVSTAADGHASGCLVGFATQTSLEPARFLVGISRRNHTYRVALRARHLAVHVVSRRDIGLARLFGSETGDQIDKFERCAWHTGPEGMPILDDAPAWFVGKTLDRLDLGDHVGYLLEPVAASAPDRAEDLVCLSDVTDLEPGHEA